MKSTKSLIYVFLLLIISTFTQAVITTDNFIGPISIIDASTPNVCEGIRITPNYNTTLYSVTQQGSVSSTTIYLYNTSLSNGIQATSTLGEANNYIFNNIPLQYGTNYFLCQNTSAGSRAVLTVNTPTGGTGVNFTARIDGGVIRTDNFLHNFITVRTGTLNNTINLTIRKEVDGTILFQNTSIITDGDFVGPTNIYINGTYMIPIVTPDNYTISATTSGYNTGYARTNMYNNNSETVQIYLNNGTSVLFNFETSTGSVIPNVELSVYRLVNGTTVLVQERVSDVSGIAQVSLETTGVYSFTTFISGYNNYSFSLNPVLFTSYDVVLTPLSGGNDIEPSAQVIFSPTSYYRFQNVNFEIEFLSQYDSLTNYSYNVTYPGGSQVGSGTNTHGQEFTNVFNLNNAVQGSVLTINYSYTLDNGLVTNNTYTYNIVYVYSNRTWVNLGNNINATTGQDSVTGYYVGERIIIVTLITIIMFGVGWSIGGGTAGLIFALIPILFFTQTSFVPKQLYYVTILIIIFYLIGKGSDS